jgi:hypothetical protein
MLPQNLCSKSNPHDLPIEIHAASIQTMGTNQSPCSESWVPQGEHAVQGGASFLCQLPHVLPHGMQVPTVVQVWCWTGKGVHGEPIYCVLVSRTKALNWNKFTGITRGMLLTQVQEQGTDAHLIQCVVVPPVVKCLVIYNSCWMNSAHSHFANWNLL